MAGVFWGVGCVEGTCVRGKNIGGTRTGGCGRWCVESCEKWWDGVEWRKVLCFPSATAEGKAAILW